MYTAHIFGKLVIEHQHTTTSIEYMFLFFSENKVQIYCSIITKYLRMNFLKNKDIVIHNCSKSSKLENEH